MGGMSNAHPTHFLYTLPSQGIIFVRWGHGGVRTKVLSKDEGVKIMLSMLRRGVAHYVVVVRRVRLLVMLIVACRSRLVSMPSGGPRVK